MILLFITPLLGVTRNYIKYKQINIYLLLSSNLLYFLYILFFNQIQYEYSIYEILIYERWIMFIIKIGISLYNDDYNIKRNKYINKYNLKY